MCGIAGWFGEGDAAGLAAMQQALRHRGPDGSGQWHGERAALAHTRLAILDLSPSGAQPMAWRVMEKVRGPLAASVGRHHGATTGGGPAARGDAALAGAQRPRYLLTFNGEIYNHRELRRELEASGERFSGRSDTEVLLRLLSLAGESALTKLAGMFALAYWDEANGEGLLARDAYGIKPLYYRIDGGTLRFASESHALRRDADAVDAEALNEFFLWGAVPEPRTLYRAVRQVPAGHLLRWKAGKTTVERWYHPNFFSAARPVRRGAADDLQLVARTRAALEESVRRHLVSDVPVGIFLSGGIDSTVVLALARQELDAGAELRTFSIGFENSPSDEAPIARRTAEHFGSQHTEWRMTAKEGAAEFPAYLAAVDQPTIDGFNTWCVSRLASREGMKVVLSGLGGDEWFAGYPSFYRLSQYRALYRRLGPLRLPVAGLLNTCPPGSRWRRLADFLAGDGGWLHALHAQRGLFTTPEAALLVQALLGTAPGLVDWEAGNLPSDARAIAGWLEVTRYLRNQLLRDSDTFSMAHGLELRTPLVDSRLAETLLGLPTAGRLRQGKQLLLKAVPEIPSWVTNQLKHGFRFPLEQWLGGQTGEVLAGAQRVSPVPLKTWYRARAVAAALGELGH